MHWLGGTAADSPQPVSAASPMAFLGPFSTQPTSRAARSLLQVEVLPLLPMTWVLTHRAVLF